MFIKMGYNSGLVKEFHYRMAEMHIYELSP